MIDRIIEFSVRNKLIVGLLVLLMAAFGVYSASKLPVDAVPDITNNQVLLITVSPSLAAPEVERLISMPIERVMASLPELKEMRSISRFGLSNVTVVFNDNVDIYRARQEVSERISQLKNVIPPGIGETDMGPVSTGLGEVYQYYVVPKAGYENRYTLTELRTMQEWIVRRQLLGVPGVADVSSLGGKLKEYQVVVNTDRLKSLGITLDELYNAVQQNNENTGGAYIEKGPNAYYIRTEGLAASLDDLRNIPVKNVRGLPLKLGDVAGVRIGNALRFGAMYNDKYGEVSGAVVLMLKGANAMQVVKDVKAKVEEIKKRLPEGVTIVPYYERSKMVGNSMDTVKRNLIEGALIVIFVLVFFLGNLRSGLVVASVIPLSMLFALIMMDLFHVSANLMSLGALDFGLIVDGAVIIVEGVMHRFRDKANDRPNEAVTREEVDNEVKSAASRLMNSAIFGQFIILVVYLPILSLQGIEGKMFRPMAETVAFALIGAFLLSLTYVPMMTALTVGKNAGKPNFADKIMAFLQKHYSPLLDKTLQHTKIVLAIGILMLVGAFFVFKSLGGEFIPQLEEGDYALDARFLPGTSLTKTIEGMKQAADALKKYPEVEQVTCRIGSAEIPTDPMSLEQCDMFIILKDKTKWTTAKDYDGLEKAFGNTLAQIPGLSVGFEYPVQMRFNELISGAKQDVVVKIFGDDLNQLSDLAQKVSNITRKVNGAADVYGEKIIGLPQLVVHYNRAALAQYNLNISQVNHTINAVFAGEKAGSIYEGERQFDLMLRMSDTARADFNNLEQLQINTPGGQQIPLSQVANISVKDGPNQIQRENGERRVLVSFNVRGRDVQSVVNDLQQQIKQKVKLPPGYYIEYGGQFENLKSAKKRLSIAVPASLLFILVLLYFAFRQFKEALLVFSAIPLAAIGGVFALWARGMNFSISAGVGFIALFGVAVLNGIVLISEFNRLRAEGMEDTDECIRKGTGNRLRPVLMTATVASLGFFPMAISTHAGAEVQRPLATVVIGGLITATLLTLLVLPALYKLFASEKKKKKQPEKVITAIIILLALSLPSRAQLLPVATQQPHGQSININDAVKTALANNASIKSAQNQVLAASANVGTAYELPKTQLLADAGKINSPYIDNRFSVTQTLPFPGVFSAQKSFLNAETKLTALQEETLRNQIAYQVRDVYVLMATDLAKIKLLDLQDSVYAEVIRLEKLRFDLGETSRINLTSAEAKAGMLRNQRLQLVADVNVLQSRWRYLLGTEKLLLPQDQSPPAWQKFLLADSAAALDNPEVRQAKQQLAISKTRIKVSQARRLPELLLGYNNQSFVGPDLKNTNDLLTRGNRFSSYQAGLSIPLFFGPYRSAVKYAVFQKKAAEFTLTAKQSEWLGQWRQTVDRYQQQLQSVTYYETLALKQAAELLRTASLSFKSGGISYIEYVTLYNQAVQLQTDRLDALLQLDQTINTIWYYQAQTEKP